MRDFFDKLYFGGYYMYLLTNAFVEYIVYKPLKCLFLFLGKISIVRNYFEEKKGKTFELHVEDSLSYTKDVFDKDLCNFGHFQTGRLLGPMLAFFWGDILMGIYTIFGEDIGIYKFNRDTYLTTGIFIVVAIFVTYYLAFGGDKRNERVVKEYRKKTKNEKLKAFFLFNIVYIIVIAIFIALFAYNAKLQGGW